MSKDHFEKLNAKSGGFLLFSNFLSTSGDKEKAMNFALRNLDDVNKAPAFMTIVVDPSMTKNVPFANMEWFSVYSEKERNGSF